MSKNIIKTIVLGMLIITCIVQTAILWLGGVSSHNFLAKETNMAMPLSPEAIWINTVTFAYPISEHKREYDKLVMELSNFITSDKNNLKLSYRENLGFKEILSQPGIIYEYNIPVSLEEIAGTSIANTEQVKNLAIKSIAMIVSASNTSKKVELYLLEASENRVYKTEVYGDTESVVRIQEAFTKEEITRNVLSYQASVFTKLSEYIDGNVFLGIYSKDRPLEYNILRAYNPIETTPEDKIEKLEGYVNSLFANPLTKEIEEKENGSVVFTEYRKGVVTYKPSGVMEYVNFNTTSSTPGMTRAEGYRQAISFIENTDAISQKTKTNLYLSKITRNNDQYIYCFDLHYKGFKINMTDKFKKQLEVSSAVEVSVKNNQVAKAKWLILDIGPSYNGTEYSVGRLEEGYVDPIDALIEQRILYSHNPYSKLDDMECVYLMDKVGENIKMQWGANYNNVWYYPK
ncbi:MAG: hypothetical protein AB9856_15165 [Cellulosilyticaceae bacterium]